jgi:hypothetical protein
MRNRRKANGQSTRQRRNVLLATGLLWFKLLDVRAKQGREALTSEERSIRKATEETEFNVPQPIATYLHQISQYTDKMGKTTDVNIPNLPAPRAQGMGGIPCSRNHSRNTQPI